MTEPTVIAVVDDEPDMLRAIARLLRGHGFEVRAYESPEEFLAVSRDPSFACVLLDLSMPGLDGLAVQRELLRAPVPLPVVFLTGNGDIPASVRAMKAGAVHFLTKPPVESDLLDALRLALRHSARDRAQAARLAELRQRFDPLTPREQEVLRHVIAGSPNKCIAAALGVGEQTVKVHRMSLTRKTGLPSVAELVRAAALLGIKPAEPEA